MVKEFKNSFVRVEYYTALRKVLEDCKDPYARAYAQAGLLLTDEYECRVQCMYVLSNADKWTGDLAKSTKHTLRVFTDRVEI
jgi:hypothetical protein